MTRVELSQVQAANLNMLMLIVECAKHDTASACSQFGLDAEQAEYVSALANQDVLRLVAHIGDQCLFPPRADLIQVLSWPPQLASALLMVHPASARRLSLAADPATASGTN